MKYIKIRKDKLYVILDGIYGNPCMKCAVHNECLNAYVGMEGGMECVEFIEYLFNMDELISNTPYNITVREIDNVNEAIMQGYNPSLYVNILNKVEL